jgi:hypothetical protein
MPSEVMPDITLRRVTPCSGEEALGKWRAPYRNHGLDSEPGSHGNLTGCRAGGITMRPRGVCRRVLEPRAAWEGPLGKSRCCQPDSGKPTVRDERGAHGDVDYGGIRNPLLGSKERRSETLHLRLHAPCFYPTIRTTDGGRRGRGMEPWLFASFARSSYFAEQGNTR